MTKAMILSVSIEVFEYNQDNIGFLLHDNATGATAAMDAGDEIQIGKTLQKRGWQLTHILITHHDWDHTDAIIPLKKQFNVQVYGPKAQENKIAGLDVLLEPDETVQVGKTKLRTIDTSGHTKGHISFFDQSNKNLFCGDALFSLGCGRLRECEATTMWEGLNRLRQLPDDTNVYCSHEYSADNAKFALSIDPDNEFLQRRATQISAQRANNKPTVPFNLGIDKQANPFLRADDLALALAIGMSYSNPAKVFAALRKAKDIF